MYHLEKALDALLLADDSIRLYQIKTINGSSEDRNSGTTRSKILVALNDVHYLVRAEKLKKKDS